METLVLMILWNLAVFSVDYMRINVGFAFASVTPNETRGNPSSSEDFLRPDLYLIHLSQLILYNRQLILYNRGRPKLDFEQ
jgi:hypothetical protein